jgi:hypothetical protein
MRQSPGHETRLGHVCKLDKAHYGLKQALMSTHASVLVDSVGPPSAEVCITASSFP